MNKNEIINYLPHRYPFLLIDRLIDFKKHDYLIAQKNVSNNEPFFQGHFPDQPVFPGVLILEAMAWRQPYLISKVMKEMILIYYIILCMIKQDLKTRLSR